VRSTRQWLTVLSETMSHKATETRAYRARQVRTRTPWRPGTGRDRRRPAKAAP